MKANKGRTEFAPMAVHASWSPLVLVLKYQGRWLSWASALTSATASSATSPLDLMQQSRLLPLHYLLGTQCSAGAAEERIIAQRDGLMDQHST